MNRTFNFLCPNGTIFSQETLVCVWWNQFDCNSAPGLFGNNANLYDYSITGSPPAAAGDSGRPGNDFGSPATGPSSAPYPSTPSFGSGPTGPYPAAADGPINPSGPSGFPSTPSSYPTQDFGGYQGGPPSPTYAPPSNVPSQGFVPQTPQGFGPAQGNDAPYPAAGQPQTPPTREYLPPRRG